MHTDDTTTGQQPDQAVDHIDYTERAASGWNSAGYTEMRDDAGRVLLYQHHGDGSPMLKDPIFVEHIAQAGPLVLIVGLQTHTEPDPGWAGMLRPVLIGIVLASAELAEYPLLAALLNPPSPPAAPLVLPLQRGNRRAAAA